MLTTLNARSKRLLLSILLIFALAGAMLFASTPAPAHAAGYQVCNAPYGGTTSVGPIRVQDAWGGWYSLQPGACLWSITLVQVAGGQVVRIGTDWKTPPRTTNYLIYGNKWLLRTR